LPCVLGSCLTRLISNSTRAQGSLLGGPGVRTSMFPIKSFARTFGRSVGLLPCGSSSCLLACPLLWSCHRPEGRTAQSASCPAALLPASWPALCSGLAAGRRLRPLCRPPECGPSSCFIAVSHRFPKRNRPRNHHPPKTILSIFGCFPLVLAPWYRAGLS
jgi:hypothetical protein